MADVIFVGLVAGFFALATAYVRACAAVVGAEPAPAAELDGQEPAYR